MAVVIYGGNLHIACYNRTYRLSQHLKRRLVGLLDGEAVALAEVVARAVATYLLSLLFGLRRFGMKRNAP